jgi:hypothetical protein
MPHLLRRLHRRLRRRRHPDPLQRRASDAAFAASTMKHRRTSNWRTLGIGAAMAVCAAPCLADDPAGAPIPARVEPASSGAGGAATGASADSSAAREPAPNAVSALALQHEGAVEATPAPRDEPLPTVAPAALRWRSSAELVGDAYHFSLMRGGLDLGMSFDTATRASRPHDVRVDTQGPVISTLPSVSLGLRSVHDMPASSLLARASAGSDRASESRVGIQWKPAQSQVSFLREGLGMRLDSNESITMKLRKGLFGVYLQRRF